MHPNTIEARRKIQPFIGAQQWRIFLHVLEFGPVTRRQLEHSTRLGTGSVNPRVLQLIKKGLIREGKSIVQENGRRAALLEVAPPEERQKELF